MWNTRVMPIGLQIKMLKDRFRKYNKDREKEQDLEALLDEIDFEAYIGESNDFRNNLEIIQRNFPQYHWDKPEELPEINESLLDGSTISVTMEVKPYKVKSKGKLYTYGHVTLNFKPALIGQEVIITIQKLSQFLKEQHMNSEDEEF